eukprot:TRINITY_DN40318_c0_g1_i1.p1 TRINITY_DN40318_c0_g1~~TRINITY_DN40318_c0_g1_i1.p1  ORF type:complete len:129 (-),score=26.09 TRINITY_DN40318_c0_g1_i1:208-594(-)
MLRSLVGSEMCIRDSIYTHLMKIDDDRGVPIDLSKKDEEHGKNLQFLGFVFALCTLGLSCLPLYFWMKEMRRKYGQSGRSAEEGMIEGGGDGVVLASNEDNFPTSSHNSNNTFYQFNQTSNPFDYNDN